METLFSHSINTWKCIDGWDGYEINQNGEVRSYRNNYGNIIKIPHILKPQLNNHGYYTVHLHSKTKRKILTIHRLVAITFIPNHNKKPQVNHINGIKTDNKVKNLEWVTCSENIQHAYDTKLKLPSKYVPHDIPSSMQVYQFSLDGTLLDKYKSMGEARVKTGAFHIHDCLYGKRGQSGGFRWSFKPNFEFKAKIKKQKKEVYQFSNTCEFITKYSSIYEASKLNKVEFYKIHKSVINGETCGGFKWSYSNTIK